MHSGDGREREKSTSGGAFAPCTCTTKDSMQIKPMCGSSHVDLLQTLLVIDQAAASLPSLRPPCWISKAPPAMGSAMGADGDPAGEDPERSALLARARTSQSPVSPQNEVSPYPYFIRGGGGGALVSVCAACGHTCVTSAPVSACEGYVPVIHMLTGPGPWVVVSFPR